jgi:hypothetical protein
MARREADRALLEEERKAIFLALVQAQDGEVGVTRSRKEVTERFGSATASCGGSSRRAWPASGPRWDSGAPGRQREPPPAASCWLQGHEAPLFDRERRPGAALGPGPVRL